MTDKVQKILSEIATRKLCTMDEHMAFYNDKAKEDYWLLSEIEEFIKASQEEPVSIWHDASKETPTQGSNILMIRKEEGSDFPPIAGCFHGTNLRLDGRNWGYYNGFCYNEIEPPVKWAYIDDILNLSNVERTVKNWKEPVSEDKDLEETIKNIKLLTSNTALLTFEYGFHKGAKWQEKKDQETIELAEDHAMLAGIIKGTEHTIGKIRSILNKVAYENNGLDVNGDYCEQPYVELDNEFRKLLKEG